MKLLFLVKEGVVGLKRARVTALISVVSITLSLTLMGIFYLGGYNFKNIFLRFYQQIEIEAFLEPGLSDKRITELKKEIGKEALVETVRFISSRQALEEFKKSFGEDISYVLEENPLPASFRIVLSPRYSSPEVIETLARKIDRLPGVEEVIYQKAIIEFVHKYFGLGLIVAGFFALLLLVIITILIFNTIRLTIHSRMEIIHIMRLVGATNRFIKGPFIIEGILQGLIGGGLALGLVMLSVRIIRGIFYPQLIVPQTLTPFLIGMGLLLGLVGSYLSVNKYLR